MIIETYWRIEDLKKLLKIQEEAKFKCHVTRSEENDLKGRIKLMEEAFKEGQESVRKTGRRIRYHHF